MKILIVDDRREVAELLSLILQNSSHETEIATSGISAIRAYSRGTPDVVLMDYQMPRLNGATACRHIVSRDPNAKVVIFSGLLGTDDPIAMGSGAVASFSKPFGPGDVNRVFERIGCPVQPLN